MVDYDEEPRLKQCLERCIEAIVTNLELENAEDATKSDSDLGELIDPTILEDVTDSVENHLKNNLKYLSKNARLYLLAFLHEYHYEYEERKFTTPFSRKTMISFKNELQAMVDSLDASRAAWDDDQVTVQQFIKKYPSLKDKTGFGGVTLLYLVAKNNRLNLTKFLLEKAGCSVNAQNQNNCKKLPITVHGCETMNMNPNEGSTALHGACSNGHLEIVKYLIERGADPSIKNSFGETAYMQAKQHPRVTKYLDDLKHPKASRASSASMPPAKSTTSPTPPESDDEECVSDGIWEYKPFADDQWFSFSKIEADELRKSLAVKSAEEFKDEVHLVVKKGTYGVRLINFLRSGVNLNYSDRLAWVRCRGSPMSNFRLHAWWQIMFSKYPSAESARSTKMLKLPSTSSASFKVQLHVWYTLDEESSHRIEERMKNRATPLKMIVNRVTDEALVFDLENFTFNNQSKSICGFLRWLPKMVSTNSKSKNQIIDVDASEQASSMQPVPLTVSRFRKLFG